MSKPHIIQGMPIGWWFNEGRIADQWSGPFKTAEEAEECALALAPDRVEFIKLLRVMPWEKREVRVKPPRKYEKCRSCKGGFVGGRCCLRCDGTGRIELCPTGRS
jgi:hypothetical protein